MNTIPFLLSLAVASALTSVSLVAAEENPPADPLAPIKSQLKDPEKPFSLLVEFTLKPASVKEFRALARESVKLTRQEEGNLGYEVHQDIGDAKKLIFWEKWASLAALEKHITFDYVKSLLGRAEELCEGKPVIRVLTPSIPGIKPGTINKKGAKASAAQPAPAPAQPAKEPEPAKESPPK
jgi:quinol monooxygenase YgiN